MNDTLLYTHPQKDGKYRLKSSLPVANMKVDMENQVPWGRRVITEEMLGRWIEPCSSRRRAKASGYSVQ